MILWTTVEAGFEVPGRGFWIFPVESNSDVRVCEKDAIELRTPDGRVLKTCVAWISTAARAEGGRRLVIGLRDLTPAQVPAGTEIWLVER